MATGEEVALNLRVETVPAVYGMDVVMRLFNMRIELFKLENLGLASRNLKLFRGYKRSHRVMVLIVGPLAPVKQQHYIQL
jgi:type II secretory ATPase GspE/PulE/Tfp pilus assembly ATPase PilB-like protein